MSTEKTTFVNEMCSYPASQWVPHKPETWPWRFATLREPTQFREWHGHGAKPEWTEYWLPAGTRVKIVMVSRFGDVGITEHLDRETGYGTRVFLNVLEKCNA